MKIRFDRGVDTRSVTLECGLNLLFSDFNSTLFHRAMMSDPHVAAWVHEAGHNMINMLEQHKLDMLETYKVLSFLFGMADELATRDASE